MRAHIYNDRFMFTYAGEVPIDEQKLEMIQNNSFTLSAQQFAIVESLATGTAKLLQCEGGGLEYPEYDEKDLRHFLFQPGKAAYRDRIQVYAIDRQKNVVGRYFVQAYNNDAAAQEQLMSFFKPHKFIGALIQMSAASDAKLVAVEFIDRWKVAKTNGKKPNNGKHGKRHNEGPAHFKMGDKWPKSESAVPAEPAEPAEPAATPKQVHVEVSESVAANVGTYDIDLPVTNAEQAANEEPVQSDVEAGEVLFDEQEQERINDALDVAAEVEALSAADEAAAETATQVAEEGQPTDAA